MKSKWRERLYAYGCMGVLLVVIGVCGMLCSWPPKPQLKPQWRAMTIKVDGQTMVVPLFSTISNLSIEIK